MDRLIKRKSWGSCMRDCTNSIECPNCSYRSFTVPTHAFLCCVSCGKMLCVFCYLKHIKCIPCILVGAESVSSPRV